MVKLILSITILVVNGYNVMAVSLMQGQEATLHFPYPCDSTKVTLQHSHRVPFYQLTDGSSLSLQQDQVPRFKVHNSNDTDNCSLELSISNLLSIDQGTYILIVYKDGEILEQMHRIWLRVDYPPGEASCVVANDEGGDRVSIDCTAKVGSLSGIDWMLSGWCMDASSNWSYWNWLNLLKQNWFSSENHQSAFCCSSTLIEYLVYIERCDCDDTALYLDDASSSDPCPTIHVSTKTSTTPTYRTPDLVEKSQPSNSSDYPLLSHTDINECQQNDPKLIG